MTFARIKQACDPLPAEGFVFFVLTLDQHGFFSGKPWIDADHAYKELSRMSRIWLKRLRRWMSRRGMDPVGSEWAAVVEAQRNGFPHVNFLVYAPELAEHLRADRAARELAGLTGRDAILLDGALLEQATESGWGKISTADAVRSKDALAGYFTKLAANADSHYGEVAKLTQLPLNAPQRFRRLRSGKGFLPPRHKGSHTGCLVRRRRSPEGDWEILPMNPPKDPAAEKELVEVRRLEENLIYLEEDFDTRNIERRARGDVPLHFAITLTYVHGSRAPPAVLEGSKLVGFAAVSEAAIVDARPVSEMRGVGWGNVPRSALASA